MRRDADRELSWNPVLSCDELPECIVWPESDFGDEATRWWVANDAETATRFRLDEAFGPSIEPKSA